MARFEEMDKRKLQEKKMAKKCNFPEN